MFTKRLGFLIALCVLLSAPLLAQTKIDERLPADKDVRVDIKNVKGSVKVIGWDQAEVYVSGTLGKGSDRLDFSGSKASISVHVIIPNNAIGVEDTDLTVMVPFGSQLEITTVSATIDAQKVTGTLYMESVSGSIRAVGDKNRFDAKSTSGEIKISMNNAQGKAKSVSGDITLLGVSNSVEATSVSGSIVVAAGEVKDVEIQTTSGDIGLSASLAKNARVEIKSVSGDIELSFPANVAARFELSSFSGNIKSDFSQKPTRKSKYGPGMELNFSTGDDARVEAESLSGSINLMKH